MSSISLMFSGGVDSTAAVLHLANTHDHIHLLTFSNGYGHYGFGRARRRAEELRERLPGRISYHFQSIRPLFEAICLSTLAADYARFDSGFVWCLGCKLAMHTASVRYARAHGLVRHTDGSSSDTSEMVEQMLISLSMISHFYADHGIDFVPTGYDVPREQKIQKLRETNVRMGLRVLDRHLGIQPSCVPGELYYLPYLLLGRPPVHRERTVAEYIRAKRRVMDRLVAEGID